MMKTGLRLHYSQHLLQTHLLALVPEELAGVFNDLLVRELRVRLLLTQRQDFPQSHCERPHITGHGELPLREPTETGHMFLSSAAGGRCSRST